MILSFSFCTEELSSPRNSLPRLCNTKPEEEEEEKKKGERKKKERNRREREFNPLSGTSRMDVSASFSAQKFERSVASRHTGVVVALRLCASLHWK